jgi:mono/diheme cytochrome c family protein
MLNSSRKSEPEMGRHGDAGTRGGGERISVFPRPRVSASLVLLLLLLTGCRRDMQDQPRMKPYRASSLAGGQQLQVEGTVPRGYLRENREFYTGKKSTPTGPPATPAAATNAANAFPDDVETIPMTITKDDLDRGQERYNIYCSVCHGMTGYGDGIVARRGFNRPSPASYHQERLLNAPAGHFFDVMTNGWGAMPSYASQVPVEDRWRIAAYLRALQLSQRKAGGNPAVREGATTSSATETPRH